MMIKLITNRALDHISYQKGTLQEVLLSDTSCLDLETTGLHYRKNNIIFVILGDEQNQYVIDYNFVDKEELVKLLSKVKLFIGHNLSFDLPFLIERGFTFNTGQIYDTMETELTLVKGTKHSVSLKNTLKRRLGLDVLDKGITKEFTYMSATEPYFEDRHVEYAYKDILYLEKIKQVQMAYINKLSQQDLVQANNDMVVVVSYMKTRGMYLNKEKWMKLYYGNLAKTDELELALDEELNRLGYRQKPRLKNRYIQTDLLGFGVDVVNKNLNHINYSSPDQIKGIFRYFKQPIPKTNKKVKGVQTEKETTGTDELEDYLLQRPNSKLYNFLKLLIEYRVYQKRVTTYGKAFLEEHLSENFRIHPDFKINRTATGRMSSDNPNAQNIPALSSFRSCFEGEGNFKIYTCDLSSAELRILASLSDDKSMKKWYRDGEDLHGYLATPVYHYLTGDTSISITKKTNPDFRNQMKTINFGIAYGASGTKVGKVLNISKEKGNKVLEIMKGVIPNAFRFLEEQREQGQTTGIIKFDGKWNQIRYFEQIVKGERVNEATLGAIGREAMNCRLQGINGQMIKLALINIFNYIREHNLKSGIISAVHDEIVIEVAEGEEGHCSYYHQVMINAGNYFLEGVEMEVEDKLDKCWSK